jgi:hypothetical protein
MTSSERLFAGLACVLVTGFFGWMAYQVWQLVAGLVAG